MYKTRVRKPLSTASHRSTQCVYSVSGLTGTEAPILTLRCARTDSADLVVPENRDSAQKQAGGGSAANSASKSGANSAPGSGAGASKSGSAYKNKRSSAAGASNWLDSAGKENAAKNFEAADGAPPPPSQISFENQIALAVFEFLIRSRRIRFFCRFF